MKLRNRTLVCMSLVLACCSLALGLALAGMQSAKNRFVAFVDIDQQGVAERHHAVCTRSANRAGHT